MTIEEKIEFWTKSLIDDHSETNVRKFMADSTDCSLTGHGMACPICSHGCFKVGVMQAIDAVDNNLASDICYTELKIMTEHRTFD